MTPKSGEAESDFMARCKEGLSSDVAGEAERTAACQILWKHGPETSGSGDSSSSPPPPPSAGNAGKPSQKQEGMGEVKRVTLCEVTTTEIRGPIDPRTKTIRDVAILREKSRNGRRYSEEARKDAVRIFENAKVYTNHRDSRSRQAHPIQNYVGRVRGLYLDNEGVVRAKEFKIVNESHWPLVHGIASGDPTGAGFSIDGDGEMVDGVVTSIKSGRSVDVVSDPAATSGLFEEIDVNLSELTVEKLREERSDLVTEIESVLAKEKDREISGLKAKIKELEGKKTDPSKTVESRTVARLRKLTESGAKLSTTQIKAFEAFESDEDAEQFLKELKEARQPQSKGKASSDLTNQALMEVFA